MGSSLIISWAWERTVRYDDQFYYSSKAILEAEFNAATAGSVTTSQPDDTRGSAGDNSPKFTARDLSPNPGTTAALSQAIQQASFLPSTDNLRPVPASPALGKGYTGFAAVGAVSKLSVRGLFAPTLTAPGVAAGTYQTNGTSNQQ